jgi:hypothetical protein
MNEVKQIMVSKLPDIDKLVKVFELISNTYIQHSENEIELARALKDQETEVKEKIKVGVMRHACTILKENYKVITGRSINAD